MELNELEPEPLNLYQASIALVKDNSYLAFTSPVKGERYRFETRDNPRIWTTSDGSQLTTDGTSLPERTRPWRSVGCTTGGTTILR